MKNGLVFLLGFISGIIFTFVMMLYVAKQSVDEVVEKVDNGMTFFEQPGDCVSTNQFEVMQVLDDNYALAYEQKYEEYLGYMRTDLLVLVTNDEGIYYYDEQTIKVPKGKCMRQVGIYKYQTKLEDWKTVPIVKLMDK